MTRPAWALRRWVRDKMVDRLTAEKVTDKRTIDNLANRLQAESIEAGEWAAGMQARVEKLTAELAKVDAAYDEIGDRLEAVSAIHVPITDRGETFCRNCDRFAWPCPTKRAADGTP